MWFRPDVLKNEMKVFFVKYNDPIYVKLEKLDIMIRLTNHSNIAQVLAELKESVLPCCWCGNCLFCKYAVCLLHCVMCRQILILLYSLTLSVCMYKFSSLRQFKHSVLASLDTSREWIPVMCHKILTTSSPEDRKRPYGWPWITSMKTVQDNFWSHNLTFTETVNITWNLSGYQWHYTLLMLQARNDGDGDWNCVSDVFIGYIVEHCDCTVI